MEFNNNDYIRTLCLDFFNNDLSQVYTFSKSVDELEDLQKIRFAWYFIVLKAYFSIDIENTDNCKKFLEHLIIDSDFNEKLGFAKASDLGIDLVYIENENSDKPTIHLCNFKFRETETKNSQKETELAPAYQFLAQLRERIQNISTHNKTNKTNKNNKTESIIGDIVNILSRKPANIKLHYISNEKSSDILESNTVKSMKLLFPDLEINPVIEDDIIKKLLSGAQTINAKVFLDERNILEINDFKKDNLKYTTLHISAFELIRIISSDEDVRNNNKDIGMVKDLKFENNVLQRNIRHYIKDSPYNTKVLEELQSNPNNFFVFNNGITLVADIINIHKVNLGCKYSIELIGLQVVNGGQTIRNIFEFIKNYQLDEKVKGYILQQLQQEEQIKLKEEGDDIELKTKVKEEDLVSKYNDVINKKTNEELSNHLQKCIILLKLIGVKDRDLQDKIALYTNSQTAVGDYELGVLSNKQKIIQETLTKSGFIYKLKEGDEFELEENDNTNRFIVTRVELIQILCAIKDNPFRATDRTKDLLNKEAEDNILKDVESEFNDYPAYVQCYKLVKEYQQNYFSKLNLTYSTLAENKFLRGVILHNLSRIVHNKEFNIVEEYRKNSEQKLKEIVQSQCDDFNQILESEINSTSTKDIIRSANEILSTQFKYKEIFKFNDTEDVKNEDVEIVARKIRGTRRKYER